MIKAFDFFCGAGGLTRGLLDAGMEVLLGLDNDLRLRQTYLTNNKPSRFCWRDISDIDIIRLRRALRVSKEDMVLYAACTPCQPFSTLNTRKGQDDRKQLLLTFARVVEAAPPDMILVENVPGLNTSYGKDIYEEFRRTLDRCGFNHVYAEFLDAYDFGVPQVRKRFILLASRHGEIVPPEMPEQHSNVQDYIKEYPKIRDGGFSSDLYNHEARKLQPHLKRIVEAIPLNGGNRSDITDQAILLKCHQANPTVHKDVFGRMTWDKPAPTLTRRCVDVYCGRFTHPEQHRGISLREAAAIQTFRDDYQFFGSFQHIAHQIGNAVPVLFAKALGEAVKKTMGVSSKD